MVNLQTFLGDFFKSVNYDFIPQCVLETRTQALENVRLSSPLSSKSLREDH